MSPLRGVQHTAHVLSNQSGFNSSNVLSQFLRVYVCSSVPLYSVQGEQSSGFVFHSVDGLVSDIKFHAL